MGNKICLITGSNSGIGKVTAIELAKKGYEIVMLVRDSEKSRLAYEEIKKESRGKIVLKTVDLSSLNSIRDAAENIKSEYAHIDVLINNAGLFKRTPEQSADGFEMTLAVNYLAPFALTAHLLPLLKNSQQARIVNLTSEYYKKGKVYLETNFSPDKFDGNKAYSDSKLLVVYFTKELSKRIGSTAITVNCLHPGVIATDVFREYPKWFAKLLNLLISKPAEGAKPSIFLASANELEAVSGKYYNKMVENATTAVANDDDLSVKIWEKTEELLDVNYEF